MKVYTDFPGSGYMWGYHVLWGGQMGDKLGDQFYCHFTCLMVLPVSLTHCPGNNTQLNVTSSPFIILSTSNSHFCWIHRVVMYMPCSRSTWCYNWFCHTVTSTPRELYLDMNEAIFTGKHHHFVWHKHCSGTSMVSDVIIVQSDITTVTPWQPGTNAMYDYPIFSSKSYAKYWEWKNYKVSHVRAKYL